MSNPAADAATATAASPPAVVPPAPWRLFDPSLPLALPEGSVRAILALLVIGADLYIQISGKAAPAGLDTWATVAFTYYFAQAMNRPKPAG